MKKAIVLLSGGLDSTTCLAYAKSLGFDCHALSFNYGQRHSSELQAAAKIAEHFSAKHHIMDVPIHQFGESALTDLSIDVPNYQQHTSIPITYVPARNTIFLSLALGLAEVLVANDIFIGVSAVDYSGYPDCRPDYLAAFQKLAKLAVKIGVEGGGINIHAPLIHLSKADTIKMGLSLGVDYGMSISCYQATLDEGKACGRCDSCVLRKNGFHEANILDPTNYI